MDMQGARDGDIVECDVKGRRFLAYFGGRWNGNRWSVAPITPNINYTTVTSRQVTRRWRRVGRKGTHE